MEKHKQVPPKKNGYSNGIVKEIDINIQHCIEIISVIDLSHRDISMLDETIRLPSSLNKLCLSHNKLAEVPKYVLEIENLKVLDISHNYISSFDNVPKFCDTLEQLNVAYNDLKGLPSWIWLHKPKNLKKLNISCNSKIMNTIRKEDFVQILECETLLIEIDVNNCNLRNHIELLSTFANAKQLHIGTTEYNYHGSNILIDLPCKGLNKCCKVETLKLCNTHLYNINSDIDIYKYLKHIDLSENYIHSLPNEFCNLLNLEVCILSNNRLLYLPEEINKLTKLYILLLDSNKLCMLPNDIQELQNLKVLDLYDNHLYEVPCNIEHIEKLDYAQNFLEEPLEEEYLLKRTKLRQNNCNRLDGRRPEETYDDERETDSDDSVSELSNDNEHSKPPYEPSTSSEDWDSDEYWIPQYYNTITPPTSPWILFVKKKIAEGNFCPMDAHPVSIVEKVKYEKLCNPQIEQESEGQFDDYSDDDS